MKIKHSLLVVIFFMICCSFCSSKDIDNTILAEPISINNYFPPLNADEWETTSFAALDWNENELQPLFNFLKEKNSKSFIILHKSKIAVEKYFNSHTDISAWYWASAGKTLTTAVTGIANFEGALNINNKVSDYLGINWTSLSLEKENLITCKNLLSMTTGLDDSFGNDVSAQNLIYKADANERWAYHNAYVKLQDVIATATTSNFNSYFNIKLKDKIGMTGLWRSSGDLNLYWSNSRSMARFGLLVASNGKWKDSQIIPQKFNKEATSSSQNINKSYGYLWWLNGKESYHLPNSQTEFSGSLIPNAPKDLLCALGKNDQKIYIVPSKDLVIIRMGEAAGTSNFGFSTFDVELWRKINALIE
jgi:CubicO group peptidase (beta-lactamase class C family)